MATPPPISTSTTPFQVYPHFLTKNVERPLVLNFWKVLPPFNKGEGGGSYHSDTEKSFVLRVMSYDPQKFNYFKDLFIFFLLLSDILENLSTLNLSEISDV